MKRGQEEAEAVVPDDGSVAAGIPPDIRTPSWLDSHQGVLAIAFSGLVLCLPADRCRKKFRYRL